MKDLTAELIEAIKILYFNSGDAHDGQVQVCALDLEQVERILHAIDAKFWPTRPDSSVYPCPHDCEYCQDNDAAKHDGQ